jgi:hypothetical protein
VRPPAELINLSAWLSGPDRLDWVVAAGVNTPVTVCRFEDGVLSSAHRCYGLNVCTTQGCALVKWMTSTICPFGTPFISIQNHLDGETSIKSRPPRQAGFAPVIVRARGAAMSNRSIQKDDHERFAPWQVPFM